MRIYVASRLIIFFLISKISGSENKSNIIHSQSALWIFGWNELFFLRAHIRKMNENTEIYVVVCLFVS
jgi:hypothetical protein